MRTRAWRRQQADRIKRKRRGYRGGHIGHYWDTPAMCSCVMCGNPRRHFGERTIQERRVEVRDDQPM